VLTDNNVDDDLRLHIGDGNDTASREAAARREAEALRRDARCNVTTSWRKQRGGVEDGCVRWLRDEKLREAEARGDATTSPRTRGKREERRQWTRGNGASIATTSPQTRGKREERRQWTRGYGASIATTSPQTKGKREERG